MAKPDRKPFYERLMLWVTIGVGVAAVVLKLLGIMSEIPDTLIVALFVLLASNFAAERSWVLRRIENSLEVINRRLGEPEPYLVWEAALLRQAPLKGYLERADELFISGGSMHGLFSNEPTIISDWLDGEKHARMLLILVDPVAVQSGKVPVQQLHISQDAAAYVKHIETSLAFIRGLQKKFPKQITYYLTEQTPSMTVLMVDRSKARVSLNLYLTSPDQRPAFELSKASHPKWFELFETKYRQELWQKEEEKARYGSSVIPRA